MKLLWLTQNYPPQRGGMAVSCDRITRGLLKAGVFVHIVHFFKRAYFYQTKPVVNGLYSTVPVTTSDEHTLKMAELYLSKIVKPGDYDYIVAFGGNLPLTALPVFSKLWNIPAIVFLRGNDFDVSLYSPKKRLILDQALKIASKIFVNSTEKARLISQIYDKEALFVPNGIDLNLWKSFVFDHNKVFRLKEELKIPKRKRIIGIFGHLKRKKGTDFFVKTLINNNLHNRFHFLFIGEADQYFLNLLSNAPVSYNFLMFVGRFELLPFYLLSDVIAIPSFYEGMPNVLLEALALGKIVIASAVDGLKDVMSQILPEFLFEPLNEIDLTVKIKRFLKLTKKQRQAYEQKISAFVRKYYTAEAETQAYLNWLQTKNL